MPRKDTTPQDDEKRSYGALWLVLSLLLFIGALWAVADDNIRRPWKKWQAGFNRLEISRLEDQIKAEQDRLNADKGYQETEKQLAAAREDISSGATAQELARLEREVNTAVLQDQSKDLSLRFVKSEL